jgi:acetyl esterase/lipase
MTLSRKQFLQQCSFGIAGACLPFSTSFAKNLGSLNKNSAGDTYHPLDLTVDLATSYKYTYNKNNPLLSEIAVLPGYYSLNPPTKDVLYKLEGQAPGEQCDPEPASNECNNYDFDPFNPPNYIGDNPFRYKVYYPKESIHDYELMPLPVYIFFHAGGFQECSSYELPLINNLCIELSQKGWICFTVEYRRGRISDLVDTTKISVQEQNARYRAIQDGCGAIRSIMKKNRPEAVADGQRFPFTIDEDQVFIGDTSAGGIIALGCAYYQTSDDLITSQAMIDFAHPKAMGSTYNIKQTLGKMHVDYYYAPPEQQYWPKISGVANLWGGIVIPKNKDNTEPSFFQPTQTNANPPLIAFHGSDDELIFFEDGVDQDIDLSPPPDIGSPADFNSDNLCTISNRFFSQKAFDNTIELKMCSSLNMYLVLKNLNRFTELYVDCSMGHGLDSNCGCGSFNNKNKDDNNNCTVNCIPYSSNFGLASATNQQLTTEYMAQRIAVFSFEIMNSSTVLGFGAKGRSYFKDCENFRKANQTPSLSTHACGQGGLTLCGGAAIDE